MINKELLLRITKDDCEWEYYRGSGPGGQKKQKTSSAVRCKHPPSGAVGQAQDTRSKAQNKKLAFRRMAETEEFKQWLRLEIAKVTGIAEEARRYAEREVNSSNVKVEVQVDGKWKNENDI